MPQADETSTEPTAFELYEREMELRLANFRRAYAERMQRCADLMEGLEAALSVIAELGPDATHAKRVARARKAMGWDYDADALGEHGREAF